MFGRDANKGADAPKQAGGAVNPATPFPVKKAQSRSRGAQDPNQAVRRLSRIAAALAFVAIAAAAFGAFSYSSAQSMISDSQADAKQVVVAKAAIGSGTTITDAMVELKSVPASYRVSDYAGSLADVVGRAAASDIASGSQLTTSSTTGSDKSSQLSKRIASDKVAVTIDASTTTGLAGQLKVGDKVDILTFSDSTDISASAQTVCQNAKIAALGGKSSDTDSSYASITLEVSESEAQAIKGCANGGKIDVVLKPASTGGGSSGSSASAASAGSTPSK
jgi:pilus assembly protein CpaB